ncbi:glycosyltransferase family 4 protein [Nitrospira sp. Kam-Ns4a]
MRIVIAAWHLSHFNVGLGRYARGLIEALGRVDLHNHYEILAPVSAGGFSPRPNVRHRLIRFPIFKRRVWEQVAPLLVGPHDILHFPYDSAVAWKRGKFVVTVHDVKPLLFGELSRSRSLGGLVERWLVGDRWAQMDHILTDSACSKQDLMERVGLPGDRITVVYPGVDLERFRPVSPQTSPSASRPYVLCVAGADPTKNVEMLIEAFARLPKGLRDLHDLVLTGDFRRRPDVRERVSRAGIAGQTRLTGVVSEPRLIELYQRATVFVFPSRYEGFGFPVLEAMACGCPVISSNASSLPEVAGDAALLVDPSDTEGFAKAIERVLSDPALRRDLRERGLGRAAQFTWDRTARETVAVYRRVIEERG